MKKKLGVAAGIFVFAIGCFGIFRLVTLERSKRTETTIEMLGHARDLASQGKLDRAAEELQRVIIKDPESSLALGACRGLHTLYTRLNRKSEISSNARAGIQLAKKSLEKGKTTGDWYCLYYHIGFFHSVLEQWDDARENFQAFIQAADKKDIFLICKAKMDFAATYGSEGNWSRMIEEYEKIIADPEYPMNALKAEAQFHIAEAYQAHGVEIFGSDQKARDESAQAYQQVVDRYPWIECTAWREKAQECMKELKEQ